MNIRSCTYASLLAIALAGIAHSQEAPRYFLVELPTLDEFSFTYPLDINDNARIVGTVETYSENALQPKLSAVQWDPWFGLRKLRGLPDAQFSQSVAVNRWGQITGYVSFDPGLHPFFYDQHRGFVDMNVDDVTQVIRPNAINDRGAIAGQLVVDGIQAGFTWDRRNGLRNLRDVFGLTGHFDVVAMNNAGQLTGEIYQPATATWEAYFYDPLTGFEQTGDLPDAAGGGNYPADIDSRGVVVGNSLDRNFRSRMFLWTHAGGIRPIGNPDQSLTAWAMNDRGTVVGFRDEFSDFHGIAWNERDGVIDLETAIVNPPVYPAPIPQFTFFPEGINNAGCIVGSPASLLIPVRNLRRLVPRNRPIDATLELAPWQMQLACTALIVR
ncbi:hypothetical protein HNQ60_005209 [Povalibacter uvarum]|uniref:Extracellular repeat, HAF family n=1 Tax=Povalibacter uvarum TaxID=732238 RepID=A0A841HSJ7_9GAMM|nr:hypothetical protein [Povalibacter uvarum]MBB6096287.1 hypothetical protein [Povalibacter uvarum]